MQTRDNKVRPTCLKIDVWYTQTSRRFPSWCPCPTVDTASTIGFEFPKRRCKGDLKNWEDTHLRWCIAFNHANSFFTILTWCPTKKVFMCQAVTLSQAEPYSVRCIEACFTHQRTHTKTVMKSVKDATIDAKGFAYCSSAQMTTDLSRAKPISLNRLLKVSTNAVILALKTPTIKVRWDKRNKPTSWLTHSEAFLSHLFPMQMKPEIISKRGLFLLDPMTLNQTSQSTSWPHWL